MEVNKIYLGDSTELLKLLPDESVNCCITSPPYFGLRDYGKDGQIGLEETPEKYIDKLVAVFREVKRVLKEDGTLWINIGDSYAGGAGRWGGTNNVSEKQTTNNGSLSEIPIAKKWQHDIIKPKDLIGIPWMLAFALRADGWYLRQDIIWHKPNPMPESVKDRCTKSHEYIFLLSKSPKYYFDNVAIQEDCVSRDKIDYPNGMKRNKRDVWTVNPSHYKDAHFATFPEELIEPMILACCPKGGVVLDMFMGSGTTAVVAKKNHRNWVGCELNEEYVKMAENRIKNTKKKLF